MWSTKSTLFSSAAGKENVVHQGDGGERVDGGGDSGEKVDNLLFRDSVEGPDVVLQDDNCEGVYDGG